MSMSIYFGNLELMPHDNVPLKKLKKLTLMKINDFNVSTNITFKYSTFVHIILKIMN